MQLWMTVPEVYPGTIRGRLRPAAAGRTLGRTLCSGRGQLGSGPPFCVVLGRSLSSSEHPFCHRLSDKAELGNLEFLCISNVYSSGDSTESEVYPIQLNKTLAMMGFLFTFSKENKNRYLF